MIIAINKRSTIVPEKVCNKMIYDEYKTERESGQTWQPLPGFFRERELPVALSIYQALLAPLAQ